MTARDIGDRTEHSPGGEAGRTRRAQPNCDLYIPGHMVHWIQAKLSWEHPREWGVLEEVQGQVITVCFSDRMARYRNHRVEAVLDVAQPGSPVLVSERYGVLGVPSGHGSLRCFCIADADRPWRLCSVASSAPASYGDLVDRLEDRGGFSIPAALLPSSDDVPKGVDDGA
jgi:hypothetical protein